METCEKCLEIQATCDALRAELKREEYAKDLARAERNSIEAENVRLRAALDSSAVAMRTTLDRLVIGDWRRDLLLEELVKLKELLKR